MSVTTAAIIASANVTIAITNEDCHLRIGHVVKDCLHD